MGEIIKILGSKKIKSNKIEIELNKPHSLDMPNSVHIQTEKFRLEMSQSEFNIVAFNTLKAINKLKILKSKERHE